MLSAGREKRQQKKTHSSGSCSGALEHQDVLSHRAAAAQQEAFSPHRTRGRGGPPRGPRAPLPIAGSLQRVSGRILGIQIFCLVFPQTCTQACAFDGALLTALHRSSRFLHIEVCTKQVACVKSVGAIFPTAFAHILVILTIFQSFSLSLYLFG